MASRYPGVNIDVEGINDQLERSVLDGYTNLSISDDGGLSPDVWDRQRMPLVDGISISGEHEQAVGIKAVGTKTLDSGAIT